MIPAPYAHDPFPLVQHALATPWLDPVMLAITRACEGWVVAIVGVVLAFATERLRSRAVVAGAALLAALAVDGAAVQVVKRRLDLPRPLAVLGPERVHVVGEPLRRDSMPSGHASAAAVLAAYAVRRRRRMAIAIGASALAVAGGISRVYVGAHWVLDVLAGWSLGIAIGVAGAAAAAALLRRLERPALPGDARALRWTRSS